MGSRYEAIISCDNTAVVLARLHSRLYGRKPDIDRARYRRLLIRDLDIAFSRGWERSQRSATSDWSREDSERIKRELAELFAETARRELQVESDYEIAREAGQDVLEIRPRSSIYASMLPTYRVPRRALFAATPPMRQE